MQQVKARLTEQINYWDARANTLKAQQDASKRRSSPISGNVRQRADELSDRLQRRMAELEREKAIVAKPPTVLGGALVVPVGFFATSGSAQVWRETPPPYGGPDRELERLAMEP